MGKTRYNPRGTAPLSIPLEELAQQQGVRPVSDIDELGSLLPEEDDPERMLAFILEERRERRNRASRGGAQ